jgi:hypothetical protein
MSGIGLSEKGVRTLFRTFPKDNGFVLPGKES